MLRFVNRLSLPHSLTLQRQSPFSDFFRERDRSEFRATELRADHDFRYLRIKDAMEKNKAQKIKIKARRVRLAEERGTPAEESQKLVVHDVERGIEYPAREEGIFAVVNVRGFQYKVVKDDVLVLQHLQGVDINQQIILDQVQLVGTKDYTALGRPWVETAKVYATVEQ